MPPLDEAGPSRATGTLSSPAKLKLEQYKDKPYTDGQTVFVGEPWKRQTVTYKFEDKDVVTMIKEHVGGGFHESGPYNKIQVASGWVTLVDSCDMGLTVGSGASAQAKKRLVMSSGGEALHKVRTIRLFLMSMYDILEAHRYGIVKKRAMHKDISYRNILVNPFGIPVKAPTEPTFVNTILDLSATRHPPIALLRDLDKGCVLEDETDSDAIPEQLKSRTGTPMYIARAVEAGHLLVTAGALPSFSPMPEISNKAIADSYARCYRGETMRTFRDKGGECHGGHLDVARYEEALCNDDQAKAMFYRRPRHDAESVGWCIIAFCLRSQPKNGKGVDDSLGELKKAWEKLSGPGEIRHIVLGMTLKTWERTLHPRLKFLGPFLYRLCMQMLPEYGFLQPPPAEDHLHEAFQRLLLNQISEMKEDVELDVEELRKVPELRQAEHRYIVTTYGPSIGQSSGSLSKGKRQPTKRSAPSEDEPTITRRKRAKTSKESMMTDEVSSQESTPSDS